MFPLRLSDTEKDDTWRAGSRGNTMKRYCVKCRAGRIEYFDILSEVEDGYKIRLTRISDGNEKNVEEFMSRHLFDLCFKTGYIFELESAATVA
jgi:hypothetical protein